MGIAELKKPAWEECPNVVKGIGCKIYADRPPSCRQFICGWLLDPYMGPDLKPENCHVVFYQRSEQHIVATVDEKSYTPGRATMGEDHPLVWWHCVGKGQAMYSALGHAGFMYAEPLMIQFLDNSMAWGLAQSGRACAADK